jgi:hypothetical protein
MRRVEKAAQVPLRLAAKALKMPQAVEDRGGHDEDMFGGDEGHESGFLNFQESDEYSKAAAV